MSQAIIQLSGVNKWFGDVHVLRDVDLAVQQGERMVICGPSGSGKSTLIRCINRLEHHDSGNIVVDGLTLDEDTEHVAAIRREVGMVFQQFNLFPHLSVLENLTLAPVLVRKRPRAEVELQAMALLERVGIAEQAEKFPGQLSGGQQQRVAIARALCMEPRILLFDEPTSSLDPEMVREVLDVIQALAAEAITMVVVTHEVRFARQVAHRVVLMDEGEVVEQADPETFFTAPRHERSQRFLEQIL